MKGAMLSEPPAKGSASYITGSAMVAHAATKEEVLELMKSDVYAQGVWDFDKVCFVHLANSLGCGVC